MKYLFFTNLFLFLPFLIFAQTNLKIDSFQIENGLTTYVIENNRFPIIHLKILFNGGSRVDPEKSEGLTYLTTKLLLKGTERYSARQIAEEFEFLGSTININTTFDYSELSTELLKSNFEKGLEIISEMIQNPSFPSDEIKKEKEKLISELKSTLENPSILANLYFNKFLFGESAYGKPVKGNLKSINNINSRQIKSHYKKFFLPQNTKIIIFGNISTKSANDLIKKYFDKWKANSTEMPKQKDINPQSKTQIFIVNKPEMTQSQIRVGSIGIAQNSKDEIPLMIANTILGDGFTSRLVDEIRVKRSLTYGVRSSFSKFHESGRFLISTFTKTNSTGEVIKLILDELQKFFDQGVTNDEVKKAKNYLSGNFSRELQSPEGFLNLLTEVIFYNKDEKLISNFIDLIKRETNVSIQKAIRQHFPKNNLTIVVVGNAEEIKHQLETFGEIKEIDYKSIIE